MEDRELSARRSAPRLLVIGLLVVLVLTLFELVVRVDRQTTVTSSSNVVLIKPGLGVSPGPSIRTNAATGSSDLRLVQNLGASWIRLDLPWWSIEPTPGTFEWATIDRLVQQARQRGLSVDLVVHTTPVWDRPAESPITTQPLRLAPMIAFLKLATQRYEADGVDTWEIGNEENVVPNGGPRPTVAGYVKVLRAASTAIRSVEPTADIIFGGLAPADLPNVNRITAPRFLNDAYQAGARPYFDAVAIHPYTADLPPIGPEVGRFDGLPTAIRRIMDVHGDAGKLLWATEIGWSTCPGGAACVSPQQQARFDVEAYNAWHATADTGPIFIFGLRDFAPSPEWERPPHFGMYNVNGSAKPAAKALSTCCSPLQ